MQPQQLLDIISIQTEIAKSGVDLGNIMTIVVDRTLELLGADGAAIELAEGEDMVYRAASGIAQDYLGLHLKRKNSLSGLCVEQRKTLLCIDANLDLRVNQAACQKIGLRSMMAMPLNHKGTAIGVLKAMSMQPNKFSEKDIRLLELLSELVAAAMFFSEKYDTDELFYRATHDDLTGLANRSMFMDRLRNEVSQAERSHHPIGVIIMDMNGLKYVNDTFGHRAGDAVIKEFSSRIKNEARLSDTVARLGGDEFGAILSPLQSGDGIEMTLKRIQEHIAVPFVFEDRTYQLSASYGAALCPNDGSDIKELLDLADQRMYKNKNQHYQQAKRTHARRTS